MAGAVSTTSSPALFNVSYGGDKNRGKKEDDKEDEDDYQTPPKFGSSR